MAEKKAILRHFLYNVVQQIVNNKTAVLPCNGGPATPQRCPRYAAIEAPLHYNGGSVAI